MPISGLTGQNLVNPVEKTKCAWYDGPPLIDILDSLPIEKRDPDGPLRIPVLDKQKDRGIVIHGKIAQGTVRVGDKIALSPNHTPSQVGFILDGKNQVVRYARPGENVQIKLLHIKEEEEDLVQKGHVICFREQLMPCSMLFEAEIEILELLDFKPIFSKGYACMLHIHTWSDEVFIKEIIVSHEKGANGEIVTKENPKFTKSFSTARCRVATNRLPLPLEKFEVTPELGRFTLRDEGKTIAVGKILRYKPHKITNDEAGALAKKLEATKLSSNDKSEALVFDMDSGSTVTKQPELSGIAEGDEDAE